MCRAADGAAIGKGDIDGLVGGADVVAMAFGHLKMAVGTSIC